MKNSTLAENNFSLSHLKKSTISIKTKNRECSGNLNWDISSTMLLESGKWFMAIEDAFVIFLDTFGCLDSVLKIAISRWSEQSYQEVGWCLFF